MTMPRATFTNLLQQLDELVELFENHPDDRIQEQAAALLAAVDMVHREALERLAARVREIGGEDLFRNIASDDVVEVLFGLYGLVDVDLPDEEPASTVTPIDQFVLEHGPRARWQQVATTEELPSGTMTRSDLGDLRLLLVNVAGDVYAYRNACGGTELPLDMGQLRDHHLICPWHGCEYDARTGRRVDGGKGRLQVYPVAIRGSAIELAMAAAPPRPAVS